MDDVTTCTRYAHTTNDGRPWEPVIMHLTRVAELAEAFTGAWGSAWEGRAAGMLHDLGKYGELFQDVLKGRAHKVDHSTPGARAALETYGLPGLAVILAIQAHHGGLRSGHRATLLKSLRMDAPESADGRRYAARDIPALLADFTNDGGVRPPAGDSRIGDSVKASLWDAAGLDARMVFSALVDADYLATAAHFEQPPEGYRVPAGGPALDPARGLALLEAHVAEVAARTSASQEIRSLRHDLLCACLAGAEQKPGLFTLTAPTGSGKTLAMMAFALRHAALHGLQRVVVVLPYLSIIEQSARVYRAVFEALGSDYVLEDHSLAHEPEPRGAAAEERDTGRDAVRVLAQNWDAPVIVTTTVRFFESLFANRPGDCRKLHNVARSVILFDEAQTMPSPLAVPTLAALAQLRSAYGCSIVFSTATQPALRGVFEAAEAARPRSAAGWWPAELADPGLRLFDRARRVHVIWPQKQTSWECLAGQVAQEPQALVIVNLRRHASKLFRLVRDAIAEGAYHLSTDMCPAHRIAALDEVRGRLKDGLPCRLISTQCVEAGVDIDFPAVWRALGPLDAVAQAAGRCNREGRRALGEVRVFRPPDERRLYPSDTYGLAATTLAQMLTRDPALDIHDPAIVHTYFERYFASADQADKGLEDAILTLDFEAMAKHYRWIDDDGASLLVPYGPRRAEFGALAEQARGGRINAAWLRAARPLAVSVRGKLSRALWDRCEEVKREGESIGWYILTDPAAYDPALGLAPDDDLDSGYIS
jgi:CRISPR-associated endonuclease/helicase Cas3